MKAGRKRKRKRAKRRKNGPFYGYAGGSMQHSVFKSDFYCF